MIDICHSKNVKLNKLIKTSLFILIFINIIEISLYNNVFNKISNIHKYFISDNIVLLDENNKNWCYKDITNSKNNTIIVFFLSTS